MQGQQYVAARELVALQTLTNILNYLKLQKIDIVKVLIYTTENIILFDSRLLPAHRNLYCRSS